MPVENFNILVVDDFSAIRKILKIQLQHMGYKHVCEACDGESAFDILKNKKIDLVISDWNMPRMTGYDLLKAVRGDVSLKTMPFILVTAEASQDNICMAMRLKVDQFILKPFSLELLEEKINQVIQ